MSVRLDLSHLGTVEISIDHGLDGTALKVATDRKETLDALLSDQGSLRSMLQQSGIEDPGGAVQFTMLDDDGHRQNSPSDHQSSNRRQNDERRAGEASTRFPSIAHSAMPATASASAGLGSIDITA